jgi:hypothetical protein
MVIVFYRNLIPEKFTSNPEGINMIQLVLQLPEGCSIEGHILSRKLTQREIYFSFFNFCPVRLR